MLPSNQLPVQTVLGEKFKLARSGANFVRQTQTHTKLGTKFCLIMIDILQKFEAKIFIIM